MSRRSLRPFWPPCVPLSAQPRVTWSCSQPPHASCSCLISPGLGFPFSTSSSSILNFVVLLVLSNRSGNWRAVSGLFSKKLLNSIIFTNRRWENNFFNIFYWSFYKMKRNSYDRLRMVVMAGWFVGLCVLGLFSFFLFNLKFWVETFSNVGGGILIKGSLYLPSGEAVPSRWTTALCICSMPTAPSSSPSLCSWVIATSPYFANFYS